MRNVQSRFTNRTGDCKDLTTWLCKIKYYYHLFRNFFSPSLSYYCTINITYTNMQFICEIWFSILCCSLHLIVVHTMIKQCLLYLLRGKVLRGLTRMFFPFQFSVNLQPCQSIILTFHFVLGVS